MNWFCATDMEALAQCRIPVLNESWNTWVLMRSTFEGPSDRDVLVEAEERVREWLSEQDMHADNFSVSLTHDLADVQFNDLAQVASRSTDCAVPMTLLGADIAPPVYAIVRFVLRGMKEDMPWPIWNANWLAGSDCPESATWILDRVFAPDLESVPAEKPDPTVWEKVDEIVPEAEDYTGLLIVVGLVATAAIVWKLKS